MTIYREGGSIVNEQRQRILWVSVILMFSLIPLLINLNRVNDELSLSLEINEHLEKEVQKLSNDKEILQEEKSLLEIDIIQSKSDIESLNDDISEKDKLLNSKTEIIKNRDLEINELKQVNDSLEKEVAELVAASTHDQSDDGEFSINVEATAYSTNQPSLSDYTYTGINLRQTPNVIAVDPSVIPLGSTVVIPGYGTFIAGDTGSDIVGNRIDIHMTNINDCLEFGRRNMTVMVNF